MSGELRKSLKRRHMELVRETAHHLLDDDKSDVEGSIKTIENYSKLLSVIPSPRKWERLFALAVAFSCVVLAAILWGKEYWNNMIRVQVQSETIGVKLAESWSLSEQVRFDTTWVHIERVDSVSIPVLGKKVGGGSSGSNVVSLRVKGDYINLSYLFLQKDEEVKIGRTENGKFTFHAKGPEMRGTLQVSGHVLIECGGMRRHTQVKVDTIIDRSKPPWFLDFSTKKNKNVYMKIRGDLRDDWVIRDLWVNHLDFCRRKPGISERIFESSIVKGEIGLPQVSREKRLHAREGLELTDLNGRIAEMRVDDSVDVLFEGEVKRIDVGTRGAKKNIAPSLVEFIYHNWRLPFLITLISFIWGILWSTRKLLFR